MTTDSNATTPPLPVFPDIGCGGECGFQRRGVGLQCVEGSACGRYVHPGDEHSAALETHRSEMLALSQRVGQAMSDPTDILDAARGPKAIEASNNFHAFMRGWRHAASGRAKDTAHDDHPTLSRPYNAGYEKGRADFGHAGACASVKYSHTPSPFRGEPT